jgi:hypothetical protein
MPTKISEISYLAFKQKSSGKMELMELSDNGTAARIPFSACQNDRHRVF